MQVQATSGRWSNRAVQAIGQLAIAVLSGAVAIPCGEIVAKLVTGWEPATEMYFVYEILASILIFAPLGWIAAKEKKVWAVLGGGFVLYAAALLAVKFIWLHDAEQAAFQFVPAYVAGAVTSVVLLARAMGWASDKLGSKTSN